MIGHFKELWRDLTIKRTDRLNTLDLNHELDDLEILMTVEESFGAGIKDSESETIATMGDLHRLIVEKTAAHDKNEYVWNELCEIVRDYTVSRHP